jgi:phosphoenolpyruvate-protein phosphotransferase
LTEALDAAVAELDGLAAETAAAAGEEIGAIFEAQALFARDPGIVGPAMAAIDAGASASQAFERSTAEQAAVLAAVDDEYFRERAADVRDVGRRVVGILDGRTEPTLWHADGTPAIVVADELDPSAVATIRPEMVAGIALAGGAPTGHAAIVARALGIPLVLGLGAAIDELPGGAQAAVDGDGGRLLIEPDAEELASLRTHALEPAFVGSPPETSVPVAVLANVGSALEADAAERAGAEGIGLVRTELLFLGRSSPPGVDEQRAVYRRIWEAMGGRPVVFRTLDVGGDKPADWQSDGGPEPNPALGVRGIRLGLRRPELLRDQLTALLEAAADGELWVMLPMVSTVDEPAAARAILDELVREAGAAGRAIAPTVHLGVMIEVPAAALTADALARAVDFFSIGTNDLVQYTLAADRTNPALSELASALQPAVLRLIGRVCEAGHAAGRHVAVCGEAAADPAAIPLLVGLGVDELSVAPASVGRVRSVLAGLDLDACQSLAAGALAASSLEEVRALVANSN